ncbi:hypothetical protein IWX50DRAFT_647098 [Phyllosticta citricarpa]
MVDVIVVVVVVLFVVMARVRRRVGPDERTAKGPADCHSDCTCYCSRMQTGAAKWAGGDAQISRDGSRGSRWFPSVVREPAGRRETHYWWS